MTKEQEQQIEKFMKSEGMLALYDADEALLRTVPADYRKVVEPEEIEEARLH